MPNPKPSPSPELENTWIMIAEKSGWTPQGEPVVSYRDLAAWYGCSEEQARTAIDDAVRLGLAGEYIDPPVPVLPYRPQ